MLDKLSPPVLYFNAGGIKTMKNNLTEKRLYHTVNVVTTAVTKARETGLPLNKITTQKDANVSFVTFGREQDIVNFYNYIYYSEDVVCLNRKKEKFVNYLNKK